MNKKNAISLIIILFAIILLTCFAYAYYAYYEPEEEETNTNTNANANENANLNTNESVVNTNTTANTNSSFVTNTNTATDETACSDGWSTYTNEKYGYLVMYPSTATLEFLQENSYSLSMEEQAAGLTFAEKFEEYGSDLCVFIELGESAYVAISAPENAEAGVICHRSGVGVYTDNVERLDVLTIDGTNYTGTGDIYISEDPATGGADTTLMYKNETNHVILSDNTSIEYGSTPAEDILYTDYELLRDTLICILESYSST